MELKLYDTLSKEKRAFTPLDPNNVRMYVCGPTVYDFAHIGNARPVIVFDVLFRLLRHVYGESHVTYVRNITDVDDKINDRAARDYPGLPLNEAIRKVTEQTEKQFHEDVAALGCLPPTIEPRATEHIPEMRAIIETLIAGGHAYVGEDHVLFSVASMKEYGRLARRTLDEMLAGARVDIAPYKREAMDFVLWKPSKPGEPAWPSPAGIATPGRPGWHLECSAMSDRWLWTEVEPRLSASGKAHPHQFDIHGGGVDLVFPHHENEIAQTCCAFHTSHMARTWMHNGFLMVEGEKMSKSLGNFITINELLHTTKFGGRKWPGEVLRLAMLMTHYRSPIDWTLKRLVEAETHIRRWKELIGELEILEAIDEPSADLVAFLADDLNTAALIPYLSALADAARTDLSKKRELARNLVTLGLEESSEQYSARLAQFSDKMKQLSADADRYGPPRLSAHELDLVIQRIDIEDLNSQIENRLTARARKDFKESDRIRDELAAMGIVLKDGKDKDGNPVTTWEIAR